MNTKVSNGFDILMGGGGSITQQNGPENGFKVSQNTFQPPSQGYEVSFTIPYKTDFGQSLAIVGGISQLGHWKEFKAHMKWTEGHVWVLSGMKINEAVFQYKYVVMKDGKPDRWEQGFNRIADLRLLQA